jgi:hypothetical protein
MPLKVLGQTTMTISPEEGVIITEFTQTGLSSEIVHSEIPSDGYHKWVFDMSRHRTYCHSRKKTVRRR